MAAYYRHGVVSHSDLNISCELCKRALKIDFSCGSAWYGLGMSYLKIFFDITQEPTDCDNALKAFNRAVNLLDPEQALSIEDADLFHNRATV